MHLSCTGLNSGHSADDEVLGAYKRSEPYSVDTASGEVFELDVCKAYSKRLRKITTAVNARGIVKQEMEREAVEKELQILRARAVVAQALGKPGDPRVQRWCDNVHVTPKKVEYSGGFYYY